MFGSLLVAMIDSTPARKKTLLLVSGSSLARTGPKALNQLQFEEFTDS